jgi:hypothetical protein
VLKGTFNPNLNPIIIGIVIRVRVRVRVEIINASIKSYIDEDLEDVFNVIENYSKAGFPAKVIIDR